ncbi:hypothetical protein AGMMS50256_28250 [Betaproteobacteria bacterium]|nr:hypothetical protein AGMMS50256_28250 [Betaproteobacteria bacterium]
MQFREQGKKIQCIRSIYDPISKRSHQKVITAFPRYSDSFPSTDLLADLSDEEKKLLDRWWADRQARNAADIQHRRTQYAGVTLSDLAEAIKACPEMTEEEAATAWSGLVAVAKALRKSGHPKPKRQPPVVELKQSRQLYSDKKTQQ